MNKNYKIGIIVACVGAVLISIPVYLYWMYSAEAVYQRGLASAFWLSIHNDTRDISVSRGETKIIPVELHHWKDLDTSLYVELRSDGRPMDEYPNGLSVSYDLDSSVISLSKGSVMVQSKNEAARFSPPMIKQVSSDGEIVVREFGNLTVSASKDVPLGSYYFELSTGDTKIDGSGGNGQLLTVTVVGEDKSGIVENKPKYNHTEIPDLHMVVKSTGKIYAGEEGSYCLNSVCGDIFTLVPENTITLHRGEEIQFRIVNYRPPEEFSVTITSEDPSLKSICTTDNVTGDIRCGPPEGVKLPELTKLDNDFTYKVDVPNGVYIISAGAIWQRDDGTAESDAAYYYRMQVK